MKIKYLLIWAAGLLVWSLGLLIWASLISCASGTEEFVEDKQLTYNLTVKQLRSNCPVEIHTEPFLEKMTVGQVDFPYYKLIDLDLYNGCLVHTHLFLGTDVYGFIVKTFDCGRTICQIEGKVNLAQ